MATNGGKQPRKLLGLIFLPFSFMQDNNPTHATLLDPMPQVIIVGAGLTGLTAAHTLRKHGKTVLIIEKESRIGGQIHTHEANGFVFESGPNTGVVAHPEVAELFEELAPLGCQLLTACDEAKQRWIWKAGRFHALPVGLKASVRTTLFSWHDKLRILAEPFRPKGTDENESVAQLVRRRLGHSYERYAVDPFISGVYAGDAERLVTRYALPKLYNLEQTYGSFVRGAIAKMRQPKTPRERLATKKVFSAHGGMQRLVEALAHSVGKANIVLDAKDLQLTPNEQGWEAVFNVNGSPRRIVAPQVVTTIGAYALPQLLPFVPKRLMEPIASLRYAPIVQVSVGFDSVDGGRNEAFGGLVPSCENRQILGVLFPASCFEGRAPRQGDLFSVFVGGIKHPEMLDKNDDEMAQMVLSELRQMLPSLANGQPSLLRIFRHRHAIPQYEASSGARLAAVDALQSLFPGLVVAGNLRNGIGMADRIRQGVTIIPEDLANFRRKE